MGETARSARAATAVRLLIMSVSLLLIAWWSAHCVRDHLYPVGRNVDDVDGVSLRRLAHDRAAGHLEIVAPRGAEETVAHHAAPECVGAIRCRAEPHALRPHEDGDARTE